METNDERVTVRCDHLHCFKYKLIILRFFFQSGDIILIVVHLSIYLNVHSRKMLSVDLSESSLQSTDKKCGIIM